MLILNVTLFLYLILKYSPVDQKKDSKNHPAKANFEATSNTTYIIISAVMRTGSTFFGEILNHHPEIFYVDEPLHFFQYGDTQKVTTNESKGDRENYLRRTLLKMLDCKFDSVNDEILHHIQSVERGLRRSKALHDYLHCTNITDDTQRVKECPVEIITAQQLRNICEKYKHRAMKVIWLDIKNISQLIANGRRIKIMYLIRDPRAVLNSVIQSHVKDNDSRILQMYANNYCRRMLQQYMFGKAHLQDKHQYTVVRFEDLAQRTASAASQVMQFLGLSMHSDVTNYISSHTKGTSSKLLNNVHDFYTYRSNSSDVAIAWQKELTRREVELIDNNRYCKKFINLAGYS